MTWKPIDTAPKDGTVILSDEGTVKWACFHGIRPDWYLCTSWGDIPSCADDGYYVSGTSPKAWMPLPVFEGKFE